MAWGPDHAEGGVQLGEGGPAGWADSVSIALSPEPAAASAAGSDAATSGVSASIEPPPELASTRMRPTCSAL